MISAVRYQSMMGSGITKFQEQTLIDAGLKEPEVTLITKTYENGDIYEGEYLHYNILLLALSWLCNGCEP